jgi:hypothetical protein
MTLQESQFKFMRMLPRLLDQAHLMGYELTAGEAFRSREEALRLSRVGKGILQSLHTSRLAIDLNLFKNGEYLILSSDHTALGEWWEKLGGAWGGRFVGKSQDGNHYSLPWDGRK